MQFERVGTSCGAGPSCITVTSPLQADCGFAYKEFDANGVLTGNLQLRLRPDWSDFSPDGLQRTFVHELGHFLGLDDSSPSCGSSDASMQPEYDCAAPTVMHDVTINDYLPVQDSSYGGQPKVSCGF